MVPKADTEPQALLIEEEWEKQAELYSFVFVVQRNKPVNVFIDEMETEKELYCDGLTEGGNALRAHPETQF